jgi:hypothetical protein
LGLVRLMLAVVKIAAGLLPKADADALRAFRLTLRQN